MNKLIIIVSIFSLISFSAFCGTEGIVGEYVLGDCQKLEEAQKAKCEADLEKDKLEYQVKKTEASSTQDLGKDTSSSNAMGAGIAVAATIAMEMDILGSLGLGISFEGSCYSCSFGTVVSVYAFLYQKNRHDKYDKLFQNAKTKLKILYERMHNQKNDIQYDVLLAEIEAFELIYKAASEKAKSHKSLKTMFNMVQAAAAVEVIMCSMPYSGCSPVPPAITLAAASMSASAEAKAQKDTQKKVDIAKNGLDVTRKLAAKFHKQYQEGDEGELKLAEDEINVPIAKGEPFHDATVESENHLSSKPKIVATGSSSLGSSLKSNSKESNSKLTYNDGVCLSSSSKIVGCDKISSTNTFKTQPLTQSSKLATQVGDKLQFKNVQSSLDDALKGDYTKLQAYASEDQYRLSKKVIDKLLDKALSSKSLQGKARDLVKQTKEGFTPKEKADFLSESMSPGLLAANRAMFKNDLESTRKDELANEVNTAKYIGDSRKLNEISKGASQSTNDSSLDTLDSLGDLEGIVSENSTFSKGHKGSLSDGVDGSVDYSRYNIFYTSEINREKSASLFNVITKRYQSTLVLRRLGVD